jgi:hypothetical protein
MSDPGGDIPMQPLNEAVNTTMKVEGNASVIAIEDILKKVVPSEREWKVHLGTGVPYHTTGCEMCVTFVKHLGEDKERGNVSLNATLQQLEKHWLEKLENHPFMNNGRQQAYGKKLPGDAMDRLAEAAMYDHFVHVDSHRRLAHG